MDTSDENEAMMATGGSPSASASGSTIDPSDILLQFQCLGTNDHDALVNEFVRLLGPSVGLTREAASFFLEMNNWNLQSAIGSYFDLDTPRDLLTCKASFGSPPEMTLIKDVTIGDGEEVTPNTRFKKTWKIQNSGQKSWPWGVHLRFLAGTNLSQTDSIAVDSLMPGEIAEVSLDMVSPSIAGSYQGQYRMVTMDGVFFGETIWVIITVSQSGILSLTQQLNSLSSIADTDQQLQLQQQQQQLQQQQTQQQQNQFIFPSPSASNQISYEKENCNYEWDNMDGEQASNSMDTVPILHNVTLDRVKSVESSPSQGDNLENCIQRCNVLSTFPTSPSISCSSIQIPTTAHAVTIPTRRDSVGKQIYSPSSSLTTCSPRANTLSSSPLASNSVPNGHNSPIINAAAAATTTTSHATQTNFGQSSWPNDATSTLQHFTSTTVHGSPVANGSFNQHFTSSLPQVNNNTSNEITASTNEANTNGSSQFPPTPPQTEDMVL